MAPSVGEPGAQVVQHDPGRAERHVPVVGLVQVVVQADEAPCQAVAAVALHHLATLREPLAAVRLDEVPALVAVERRIDDEHAVDDVGFVHISHGTF